MPESHEETQFDELSTEDVQELLGALGHQLTSEQLKMLLQLVNSCEDLDEAIQALDQAAKAA